MRAEHPAGEATTAAAGIREKQRRHWDAVASGWGAWLEWTERNFEPLTVWLRDAAGWRPPARILDVACGAGYPALAAARAVAPGGQVVATDLSPAMIAVASDRARAEGLANIEFRVRDAEDLEWEEAAFDGATNAFGLMFCPDPLRALREAARVLAQDGRIAVVTWDEPAKSPFFTIIREIAAPMLALPEPRPDEPGPFRLASADALRAMLVSAGFTATRIESLPMTFECESAPAYVRMFGDLSWQARVAALAPDDRTRLNEAVARATEPHAEGGRLRLVATALCASARK